MTLLVIPIKQLRFLHLQIIAIKNKFSRTSSIYCCSIIEKEIECSLNIFFLFHIFVRKVWQKKRKYFEKKFSEVLEICEHSIFSIIEQKSLFSNPFSSVKEFSNIFRFFIQLFSGFGNGIFAQFATNQRRNFTTSRRARNGKRNCSSLVLQPKAERKANWK